MKQDIYQRHLDTRARETGSRSSSTGAANVARITLETAAVVLVFAFALVAMRDCRLPRTSRMRQRDQRAVELQAERDAEIDRIRQ